MKHHTPPAALPTDAKAAIYIRQATVRQTAMGHDLRDLHTQLLITLAHAKGFTDENLVIFNDSGLPATAALEKREGMKGLFSAIERDEIKTVFIGSEYSISRDATLSDIMLFVLLCQRHGILVLTPDMVYDFRNHQHVTLFQFRLEGASVILYAKAIQSRTRKSRKQKRGKA